MERQSHSRYLITMFLCINVIAEQMTVYNLSKYVPVVNEGRDGWCVVASLIESKLSSAITECALWCFGQPHCTAFNLFDNGTCQLIDLPYCVKTLRIAGCKAYVIEGRKSEYYTVGTPCYNSSWILNNQTCYFVSEFETDEANALEACHEMNSTLVSINNKKENQFVSCISTAKSKSDYWIGLYKKECTQSATTYWLDNNPANFRNWDINSGEPSDLSNECCTRMAAGGVWKDNKCSLLLRFICKYLVT